MLLSAGKLGGKADLGWRVINIQTGSPISLVPCCFSQGEGLKPQYEHPQGSLVAQLVKKKKKIHLQCRRYRFNSWAGKISWRRDRPPTPVFLAFPGGSESKESACNAGDLGSVPGLGRSPGGGHWQPTPIFLPGESYGQRSLVGYSPWGPKELDTTDRPSTAQHMNTPILAGALSS